MWYMNLLAVIASVIVLDVILYTTQKCGPKAMFMTWLPGRLVIIIVTQFHKKAFYDWLKLSWAATSIPICFLAVFHFSLRYIEHKGRMPRFSWAHKQWIMCWLIATVVAIAAVTICFYVENEYILFAIGMGAAYINVVNVLNAPKRLENKPIKYTVCYFVTLDLAIIVILMAINTLIDFGYTKWAAIGGALPLLAVAMLVNSTCANTETAIRTTSQHIYLLAYQMWPAMASIGTLWGTLRFGDVPALVLSSAACIATIFIQYMVVKTKL